MPAQIGYFDSLKNILGKVFTFVGDLTLTVIAGEATGFTLAGGTKTLTVDEAVAMSSKANVGAELLTIKTYTKVLTATDISNGYCVFSESKDRSKIRLMYACLYNGTNTFSNNQLYITTISTSSATGCLISLGANALENHVVSLTIILAT